MDECEVCGKKSGTLYMVEIEGAEMIVCQGCSMGKQILQTFSDEKPATPVMKSRPRQEDEFEIVENYGSIIREARESLGLPTKTLAERINEKESTLIRVEKEHGLPGDVLAKKLEKALGVKLLVKQVREKAEHSSSKKNEVTLGDAVFMKDKKGN